MSIVLPLIIVFGIISIGFMISRTNIILDRQRFQHLEAMKVLENEHQLALAQLNEQKKIPKKSNNPIT